MNAGKIVYRCSQIVEWNEEKLYAVFVQRVSDSGLISLALYLNLAEQSEEYAPGTLFEIIELFPGEKDATVLVKNYSQYQGVFDALCDSGILISAEGKEEINTEENSETGEGGDEEKFERCARIGVSLPKEFLV